MREDDAARWSPRWTRRRRARGAAWLMAVLVTLLVTAASMGCDDEVEDPHHAGADEEHAAHGDMHDESVAGHGESTEHHADPSGAHGPHAGEHHGAADEHGPHDGEHHEASDEHAHHHDEHGEAAAGGTARALGRAEGPAGDAVRAEMRALEAATQAMVADVVHGRLDALPSRLRPVHGARQATVAAIEAHGYAPPGAPDDLAGFEAADDAFHESLVGLLNAARADDLPEATRQLGAVLSGCTSCHQQYRFVEDP